MTLAANELHPHAIARRETRRSLLLALGMLALAVLVAICGYMVWTSLEIYSDQRTNVLVTEIILGVAATILLAGAIHFLDQPLARPDVPAWYLRWPLKAVKRIIMVGQLATMGLAVAAVVVMIFRAPIPFPPDGRLVNEDGTVYVKKSKTVEQQPWRRRW